MGIPLWRSILFFLLILAAAFRLFPSDRQMGLYFSRSPVLENAEFHLARQYHNHPEDTSNTLRYFQALALSGQYEILDRLAAPLLRRDPNNLVLLKIAAESREARLDMAGAALYWRRILELRPKDTDLKERLMGFYINRKMFRESISLLQFFILQKSVSMDERLFLGDLFFQNRQPDEALAVYQDLLKNHPGNADALIRSAQIYEYQKKPDDALAAYAAAARENPGQRELVKLYADQLLLRQRGNEALEILRPLSDRFPLDASLAAETARLLERQPLSPENLAWLENASKRFPDEEPLSLSLAGAYLNLNRPAEAIAVLTAAAARQSGRLEIEKRLADAFLASGQNETAAQRYQALLGSLERQNHLTLKEQVLQIQILEALGRGKDAVNRLEEALLGFPGQIPLLETGSSLYRAEGQPDKALSVLEQLRKKQPSNHKLLVQMAEIYLDKGDYEKAGKKLAEYHEKTGGDYHSYHLLGDIYSARGDTVGAKRQYQSALELLRGKETGERPAP